MFKFFLIACFLFGMVGTGRAASFDCAKAVSPRDKLICSNPMLSADDAKLGTLYRAAIKALPAASVIQLRQEERNWFHVSAIACPVAAGTVTCLHFLYQDRISDLSIAALQKGPFLFTSVGTYAANPLPPSGVGPDVTGVAPGWAVHNIEYPQIASPVTAATSQWNREMVETAAQYAGNSCDIGDGDISVSAVLGQVTSRAITVVWTFGEYCHGTPHGFGGSQTETYVLASQNPGLLSSSP